MNMDVVLIFIACAIGAFLIFILFEAIKRSIAVALVRSCKKKILDKFATMSIAIQYVFEGHPWLASYRETYDDFSIAALLIIEALIDEGKFYFPAISPEISRTNGNIEDFTLSNAVELYRDYSTKMSATEQSIYTMISIIANMSIAFNTDPIIKDNEGVICIDTNAIRECGEKARKLSRKNQTTEETDRV